MKAAQDPPRPKRSEVGDSSGVEDLKVACGSRQLIEDVWKRSCAEEVIFGSAEARSYVVFAGTNLQPSET